MTRALSRTSVLIVEDEGIIAENIRELLVGLGYDAYAIASTSEDAVAFAAERCPDVVLMDIRIQGALDGIGTAVLLKERFDVPIIYLTAHADEATVERAKKTQPFGYLIKPVKPDELRSAIEVARYKYLMERNLRARDRWFSSTVQSIADAVIMVDLGGKITFMNPVAEALTGTTLEQAKQRPVRDVLCLLDADLTPRQETPLDFALREQHPVHIPDTVLQSSGGSRRLISDSAAPVMDGEVLLGAVMVFRDVTEQKRSQRQLEVADRLASLGTMAAGVAHEINNPLAVVIGNAEFVMESLERVQSAGVPDSTAAEPQERVVKKLIDAQRELLTAAGRIARIVSELQTFSQPEPEVTGSVDVRDAIEWAIRSTIHEFSHRARVSRKFEQVPRVDADETRLGQVLVNLLINAAHAIAPGDVDANEVSIATSTDDGGRVVIAVSDTGSGIPREVLSRIFEPFFTTKATGVGTGLGLSICRGIVASMGGELDVESSVGTGTTFRVKIPASAKPGPALSPLPEPLGVRRGRLMLIDDEAMVLKALTRILDAHEIVCMEDARVALARLKEDDRFDIIFCDLMMPHMTGMEFYENLLSWHPEAASRVVFLTGGAMTSKAARFLEAVPNQHIEKPFGTQSLRTTVQAILDAH